MDKSYEENLEEWTAANILKSNFVNIYFVTNAEAMITTFNEM